MCCLPVWVVADAQIIRSQGATANACVLPQAEEILGAKYFKYSHAHLGHNITRLEVLSLSSW